MFTMDLFTYVLTEAVIHTYCLQTHAFFITRLSFVQITNSGLRD